MAKLSQNLEYLSHIYGLSGGRPNLLRVLTYHRVGRPEEHPFLDPRQISATPDVFEQQMHFLVGNYNVVHIEQIADAVVSGTRLPPKAVAITFDDAYCDVQQYAWPILKKYRLPATIFVPTAYPDQPGRSFWWDRLYYAFNTTTRSELSESPLGRLSLKTPQERTRSRKRLQDHIKTLPHDVMMKIIDHTCEQLLNGRDKEQPNAVIGWDDLRRLAKEGLALGSHTQTHPILTQIPLEQVRQEVRGALQDLRREIGNVLPVFAYPNGNNNVAILDVMKEEGYTLAFTAEGGFNNLNLRHPFEIHRTNITRRTNPRIFRLRLLKWFSCIDMQRQ
jgi:peptidoglycan/xylan/chitin deacetylase (PgdA/CDA1 family)